MYIIVGNEWHKLRRGTVSPIHEQHKCVQQGNPPDLHPCIPLPAKSTPSFDVALLPPPGVDCHLTLNLSRNPENLLISPTRKILLNKLTYFPIKSVIPSPSNSNFHVITPDNFICSCSHSCKIIFLTSTFMKTHVMLILINQYLLNVFFSMTKALNCQNSP